MTVLETPKKPNVSLQSEVNIVWQNCLKMIRESISEQSYKTWFEPIIPAKLEGKKLTIQVPSQFFYEWLEENYVHLLRKSLDYAIGRDGMLEYSIVIDSGNRKKNEPQIAVNMPPVHSSQYAKPDNPNADVVKNPFIMKDLDSLSLDSYLNPNYTFDNFIEGDCNRLARAAGFAVASKPGITSFNPLMIYGGVGLGKTHLVQAIGNFMKNKAGGKFVLYVSSEKFTSQFINAIRNNSLQDFMNFYMQIDILIIDDVQFLAGKEKTQETFFHIFNHLHQSGRQIVMTSDRPPRELEGVEDRLLSRFKWGLTADLQTPDFETRIAIIQKKVQAEGISIAYEVIEYLAHSIDTNVRELEGVMISLLAQASLTRREIDLELAKATLRHLIKDSEREVTVDTIIEAITEHYKVRIPDLKGKSRLREIVLPRQVAMYLTKELTNLSLKSIGYHFGGRDHSTVIHAIQTVNDLMDTDKEISMAVAKLLKMFRS
jgi:chromosomal replication initiator protein